MDYLDIFDLLNTLAFLKVGHVICCLSYVKFYNWVHTSIHYILVSILGWPMIPTEYMLPRSEPYLCFSLFSFYGVQRVYQWLQISLSSRQLPAYHVLGWAIYLSSCWILSVMTWCLMFSETYHSILLFLCIWYD